MAQLVKNPPAMRVGFDPWVGKTPLEKRNTTPVFLPGKSHGQRSLAGFMGYGVGHNLSDGTTTIM